MMQDPKRVASVLLVLIVLSSGFLDYWSYSQSFHGDPGIWMDVVSGTANAPNQYRIGVIDTAYVLAQKTHLGLRHVLAILDVVAGLIAVSALFLVLRRSAAYRYVASGEQWFAAAGFIVLVQFYLAWLIWYQRPETMTTTAILSLALVLLAVPLGGGVGRMAAVGGLLLLAVVQGFVRADVAFALHLGIMLVCLTPRGRRFALPRGVQAATSLFALVLVTGIQYWLMRRVFPQATYGNTAVLQLLLNLRTPSGWVPFFLFMTPVAWTFVMLARRRYPVEAAEAGLAIGAAIFLAMWLTVGRIKEVRIFLPFALALAPLTIGLAMQHFVLRRPEIWVAAKGNGELEAR